MLDEAAREATRVKEALTQDLKDAEARERERAERDQKVRRIHRY